MTKAINDLSTLLRQLQPQLNPGVYAYVSVADAAALAGMEVIATLREAEGLSAIVLEADALARALPVLFRAAWITLTVHSDLQAVGLTAAFARALADAGIGCNVVAGAYHDHLFVPLALASAAIDALQALADSASVAGHSPGR